ncbi:MULTISPECIES: S1 family peptidase [Mycolicibacterium]|uniref:Serine protease n=1 Tax=Mycolicibacterium mageritense TaxID=53462 RepID=A0AAI8TMN6_MYCME|nr:S1 family peptidase [Mycolicibacterium mageritense]MBN3456297.1 serine protease [Mycobacterium sp. DSM 3803]OKH63789.1 peptidase [Mycobacterium sp. SWH-M3]MCC9185589.1 S1 family peptidase [Mycolicibacterium mageritense]TXI54873.1 MAG: serine protease [Mycolicibacterium mageritense]CDO22335.1 putative protease [Mycolicibacterium mageritense DSM 44476 = CIP 104973]
MATRHRRRLLVLAPLLALVALLTPVAAHADGPVVLGGGSGIVVNGDTFCTLTAIGHDNAGRLIGFTSAHCGGPGAVVGAEGATDAGIVGKMVAGNDLLDYAVIEFDPQKVTPTKNVNGFEIDGLGPDPVFGQVACKLGRTTGYSCGVTWGPGQEPGTIVNQVCGQPGDSGAPVTVNNLLVGMIHGAYTEDLPTCVVKFVPLHTPAVTMSFNTQLADITAKNRPGTGFVPIA